MTHFGNDFAGEYASYVYKLWLNDRFHSMSTQETRLFLSLQVPDFEKYPVWESVLDDEADEVSVSPVTVLLVPNLVSQIVGTWVQLANGGFVWATVLNWTRNPRMNEHFVVVRVERNGQWFWLSRYWDIDYSRNGPEAVANFLGLSVDEVFPISYDVRNYADGDPTALVGSVLKEPGERLPIGMR
jgi:hypothetical protein